MFCEKGVLRNFAKFTGKHLCQSLFFNKVAGAAWKRDSGTGFFLWILRNSKNTFLYRTPLVAALGIKRVKDISKKIYMEFVVIFYNLS